MQRLMVLDGFETQKDSTGATINVVPRYVEIYSDGGDIYMESDEEEQYDEQ